jgi:hypothetical protein
MKARSVNADRRDPHSKSQSLQRVILIDSIPGDAKPAVIFLRGHCLGPMSRGGLINDNGRPGALETTAESSFRAHRVARHSLTTYFTAFF